MACPAPLADRTRSRIQELARSLSDVATRYANDSLRITTRQDIQLHGTLKHHLQATLRAMNAQLVTTLGGCGDVVRNFMACPAPLADRTRSRIQELARSLSDALLPRSPAYHEIWLDGEDVTPQPVPEPLYGATYLPRKFKCGFAFPGDNCIDVYTQDIGLVPVLEADAVAGFVVLAGGGLGMTHGKTQTFPRLADPITFVEPDRLLPTVEEIVRIQRDYGDRKNRKHARMKYLIEDWGVPRFRAELERRLGQSLAPARPLEWRGEPDHLGWHRQADGRLFLGVWVENGRIRDDAAIGRKTAFRTLLETFAFGVRLTPQQNILFTGIADHERSVVEAILEHFGIVPVERLSNALRYSMACPAMPTCGLAVSEAERALPTVIRELEAELAALGLAEETLSIRMSGCPNGCSRPFIGDIGFVGRTLGKYQIYVGGDTAGTRLNAPYADLVPVGQLTATVRPLLVLYRSRRLPGEGFGDFCNRLGVEGLREAALQTVA
jgi:sulfite reductase (ferredoxin)